MVITWQAKLILICLQFFVGGDIEQFMYQEKDEHHTTFQI